MKRNIFCLICFLVALCVCVEVSSARPRRRRIPGRRPARVRPKVVVTNSTKALETSKKWPAEIISTEKILPEVIEKRKIKPDQGLIDFEVYPTRTRIYLDNKYKGYAGTLNKDKRSLKVQRGHHVVKLKKKDAPVKVVSIKVDAGYKTIIKQD